MGRDRPHQLSLGGGTRSSPPRRSIPSMSRVVGRTYLISKQTLESGGVVFSYFMFTLLPSSSSCVVYPIVIASTKLSFIGLKLNTFP